MVSEKAVSNAIGGKTARPCDGCAKKRARWYCTADDAFLCQACDSSVHSANPLARRHERVRLKTASNKPIDVAPIEIPSWNRGVTKKPRTPRKTANHQTPKSEVLPVQNCFPLVPEFNFDESSLEDNEEDQLLYRVPIYDPFLAELCTSTTNSNEAANSVNHGSDLKMVINGFIDVDGDESLHGFLPSDMDLAEFAADVESLLGRGLENESFGIEELGLTNCNEHNNNFTECSVSIVKLEEKEERVSSEPRHHDIDIDLTREPFELNFDYDFPATGEEEEEKVVAHGGGEHEKNDSKKRKLLSLDYDAVIAAWGDCHRSPWTTGAKPELDECWPHFMGICGTEVHYPNGGETNGSGGSSTMADVGREARVTRYREKRRTRLFSKKIRYEVRKLNAEKRPRMKGRFVKRTSFAAPGFPLIGK